MASVLPADFQAITPTKVTTMASMRLYGRINLSVMFYLLPTLHTSITQKHASSKVFVRHHEELPGSILAMSWNKRRRGVITKKSQLKTQVENLKVLDDMMSPGTSFKNSIGVCITSPTKNIDIKFSNSKHGGAGIIATGVLDHRDGLTAVNYLIAALRRLQLVLDRIQSDVAAAKEIISWVKCWTQGPEHYRQLPNGEVCGEYLTVIKPNVTVPPHFDLLIVSFCLSLVHDYKYYSTYIKVLNALPNIKRVVEPPLKIRYMVEGMLNYSYRLPFSLDFNRMADFFHSHIQSGVTYKGFVPVFIDTDITDYFKLELEYKHNLPVKQEKQGITKHSFNIYATGAVMQSGPGECYYPDGNIILDQNRRLAAFNQFLEFMVELRPYVEITAGQSIPVEHSEEEDEDDDIDVDDLSDDSDTD